MKPCSPQVDPQEFFTFQTPLSKTPTNKTAWLVFVAQLLKIPDL